MKENIYTSWFTLRYIKEEIESDYQKEKEKSLLKYNKSMMVGVFIVSLIVAIMNSFFKDFLVLKMFELVLYSSYSIAAILFLFLFPGLLCKNICVIKYIHYISYFLMLFVSLSFKYTTTRLVKQDGLAFLLTSLEIIWRLIWVLLGLHGFLETFTLNCITIAGIWLVYPHFFDTETFMSQTVNFISLSLTYIIIVFSAYAVIRKDRNAFYFHWIAETERIWLSNVFDNMNTGFMSIRGDSFTYINSSLLKIIEKFSKHISLNNSEHCNKLNTEVNMMINQDTELKINPNFQNNFFPDDKKEKKQIYNSKEAGDMLKYILTNLKTDSINDSILNKVISNFKNELEVERYPDENFIKNFARHISQKDGINNFKLIGDIFLNIEDIELSFEIQCRYIKCELNEDQMEFLFNDVTRTKLTEKQNAEFKYKTLFLSKIAHEFKNPLISISEIVSQVNDDLPQIDEIENSTKKEFVKNFNQIKSLSNFLLVLVKDLNYFSETQLGKDTTLIKKQENLKEIILFVKEVATSLILKSNKSNAVEFFTLVHENVPTEIYTDQWRLKQVLINLISNAVKFTLFGHVILEVSIDKRKEKDFLKFLVKDTGTGIKEDQQKDLFIPFCRLNMNSFGMNKNKLNNEMGSGFGLNIANEISIKLGEKISFLSEFDKGSSFWFNIPIEEKNKIILEENEINETIGLKSQNSDIFEISSNGRAQNINIDPTNNPLDDNNPLISNLDNSLETNLIECHPSKRYPQEFIRKKKLNMRTTSDLSDLIMKKSSKFLDLIAINTNNNDIDINEKSKHSGVSLKRIDENNYKFTIMDFILNDISKLRKVGDMQVYNFNFNNINNVKNNNNKMINMNSPRKRESLAKNNFINIIVVDDEVMTRQSTVRILSSVSKEIGIKINIIEAEDGVECAYLVYKSSTQGVKISMILSDENMNFQNGSRSSEIIKEILQKKNISEIPFYLVTAYDNNLIEQFVGPSIKKILPKPLSKDVAKKLIKELCNNEKI